MEAKTMNDTKQETRKYQEEQRARYMNGELTHKEYYTWLAGFIGASQNLVPFTAKAIAESTDDHLNDLPLHIWDAVDGRVRPLAYNKGLIWSLSDTVCVLKTLARS